jgi:hypothetical protein
MTTDEIKRRVQFFISGIVILGLGLFGVAMIQLGLMAASDSLSTLSGQSWTECIQQHSSQFLLSLAFCTSLMYAVIGAIISGSVPKSDLHPCFTCVFSTMIPLSMIGLGISWTEHLSIASCLLYVTVVLLAVTSYCAQHAKEIWPHLYTQEQPLIGNES